MRIGRPFLSALAVALGIALGAGSATAGDGDLKIATPVVMPGAFDSLGALTGTQLGALIESALGKDGYQQVTTILSTCHSGAGLGPLNGQLSGPHNAIASCGAHQSETVRTDAETKAITGVIPGLLDAIIADPTIKLDDALKKGGDSDRKVPKGSTPAERAAWESDQKKNYEANRTAQQDAARRALDKAKADKKSDAIIKALQTRLDDATKRPDWDKGGRDLWVQDPASDQSAGSPKPGQKPIAAGTKSNHAIIYQAYSDRDGSFDAETEKAKAAFKKAGFTSVDVLTPVTAADYKNLDAQKAGGNPFSVPDDRATPDNLKKKLEALKAKFNKDEALTVVVISHGGLTLNSDRTEGATGPSGGAVFANADARDHVGDGFIGSLLLEEAISPALGEAIADYSYFERWAQPGLAIQTLEESDPSGLPVGVFLNGLLLGTLPLGSGGPGHYNLLLSDDFISRLVTETDLSAGIDVSFAFGGSLDFFRLATADDLAGLGGGFGQFGISLTAYLDGGVDVPVPASLFLLLTGAVGLAGSCVRRRARGDRTMKRYRLRSAGLQALGSSKHPSGSQRRQG